MQMVKNWERRDRIPTRLKFGLNVGQSGQALDLPTNICFNSELGNANVVGKKGTFKWCPVLNHTRSIVAITNPSGLREYDRSAVVRMGFYREDDDASVERTEHIVAGDRRCVYRISRNGSPQEGLSRRPGRRGSNRSRAEGDNNIARSSQGRASNPRRNG